MKRGIIGAVLGAATVAAVLVVGPGGMASATPDQESEVCYEQVPYTVYQYSKTVETETFKTQYEIDKYVRYRTRTYTEGTDGQHYAWTGGNLAVENPPINDIPPSGNWQVNAKQEPHQHATWVNGSLHYTAASEGFASWFYYTPGTEGYYSEWSDWSSPTRWEPIGSHLAWVDVVPAANWQKHGNVDTQTYQRQWSEYPTGNTKQVSTGFEKSTVFYNDGNVGPDDLAVEGVRANWTTDQNLDHWWQLVGTDEFVKDGDRIPCSDQPDDFATEWVNGEFDCGDTTVEQTRTVTPYVLDDDFEWVLDEANATTETRTRDLTVSEQVPCEIPIRAIPVDPTVIGPDCDTAGTVVLPSSTVGYEWVKQEDGTYNAVADPGYYLDPTVQIFDPGDLSQTTGDVCADVESEPPAEVQVEVASQSPVVVPAAAPTTQAAVVAAAPTQLPSTGSSSWVTALIALVTLLGGTALVRLSRRPTD